MTISIGQMLLLLKKISGRPVKTITGSIQKYGDKTILVAWMSGPQIGAWSVNRDTIFQTPSTGDDYDIPKKSKSLEIQDTVPDMVSELSFKIAYAISDIEAKTWNGPKLYTEALDEYNQYRIQGDPDRLENIRELCIEAAKTERDYYKEPAKLLSDLGIEYFNLRKYQESEKLFNDAIHLKSDNRSLLGLGNALYAQGKHDEAIQDYNKAIEINPQDADAWNNKGRALKSLGRTTESEAAFVKAREMKAEALGIQGS